MIIEELEDYGELEGLIDPALCPHPLMSKCFVMRAEDGTIKGYSFIQTIYTVEPVWVVPEQRNTTAAYRLFKAACLWLKDNGQTQVFTHSSPATKDYLPRLGLKPTGWEAYTGEL